MGVRNSSLSLSLSLSGLVEVAWADCAEDPINDDGPEGYQETIGGWPPPAGGVFGFDENHPKAALHKLGGSLATVWRGWYDDYQNGNYEQIWFDRSDDGGRKWDVLPGKERKVYYSHRTTGVNHTTSPVVAMSPPPGEPRIVVAWTRNQFQHTGPAMCNCSADGGVTWREQGDVEKIGTGHYRWASVAMTIDPVDAGQDIVVVAVNDHINKTVGFRWAPVRTIVVGQDNECEFDPWSVWVPLDTGTQHDAEDQVVVEAGDDGTFGFAWRREYPTGDYEIVFRTFSIDSVNPINSSAVQAVSDLQSAVYTNPSLAYLPSIAGSSVAPEVWWAAFTEVSPGAADARSGLIHVDSSLGPSTWGTDLDVATGVPYAKLPSIDLFRAGSMQNTDEHVFVGYIVPDNEPNEGIWADHWIYERSGTAQPWNLQASYQLDCENGYGILRQAELILHDAMPQNLVGMWDNVLGPHTIEAGWAE